MARRKELTIIHLTDIHGAGHLIENLTKELEKPDLVLLSGDITHFGRVKEAQHIIEKIRSINKNLFAVSGNCDYPEIEDYLIAEGIALHKSIIPFKHCLLTGISGSLPCPGRTPFEFTEDEAEKWLSKIEQSLVNEKPLIFVSHQPPYNTINDDLGHSRHVGSNSIRNFIQQVRPVLCTTGHIHEGIGIDSIDKCTIVNPGPFRNGRYAEIILSGDDILKANVYLKQVTG